jgi:aminoglycoside 6-adenylyltransferase
MGASNDSQVFYDHLKQELIAWAKIESDIRVVILAGSQARTIKPADEYSDYDIEIFVKDDQIESDQYIQWMRDYSSYWMILADHHGDSKSWLILYEGGIKVDFSIDTIGDLQQLVDEGRLWDSQQRGYDIWLDKDGLASKLPSANPLTIPSVAPSQEEFRRCVDGFFYGAVYVAKQIKRDNLWKVKWADVYQQYGLLQMLEWHAHAMRDEPIDTWFRGDFMQDWVDTNTWESLHDVFAHFDAQDSKESLLASIKLFRHLTEETANKHQFDYPNKMMSQVIQYIENLVMS